MTHVADPTPGQELSDRAVSLIRTRVPILWGSLITAVVTWLTPRLPGDLGATIADWLASEAVVAAVGAAVIYAWYWVWRRLEPRIPVWLVRLVLGSALTPTYAPVVNGAAQITTLPGPADVPQLPQFSDADLAAIAACPQAAYHETHWYCPSCPWTADGAPLPDV